MTEQEIFQRTELLVGDAVMNAISEKRVIVFGIGGVGSWCVESLVRSGIRKLTIVDSDDVCISNLNRQLMATVSSVGRAKVEVLKERMLQLNPSVEINARCEVYAENTSESFCLADYDYIIDAIDSLENKASLIRRACETKAVLFSSMGAALKMNPTKVEVAEFWKVKGCPLAAALRRKFKRSRNFPKRKFQCVFSEELLENRGRLIETESPVAEEGDWHAAKVHTNGTVAHITAIFGFTLAGLVIKDIYNKALLSDLR